MSTEWAPFTDTLTKTQNPAGFKFQYSRTVTYMHPRTSMLMFGPKNATAKQQQYLYLPQLNNSSTPNASDILNVCSGVVMTATQFEGIPMCDVFEVLMYWSFRATSPTGGNVGKMSHVVVGCAVNFLKSTLLKGQIFAGTKEELEVLAKHWVDFVMQSRRISDAPSMGQGPSSEVTEVSRARTASNGKPSSGPDSVPSHTEKYAPNTSAQVQTASNLYTGEGRFLLTLILIVLLIQLVLLYGILSHFSRTDEKLLEVLKLLAQNMSSKDNASCDNSKS